LDPKRDEASITLDGNACLSLQLSDFVTPPPPAGATVASVSTDWISGSVATMSDN